ncbi:lipoyl(octanoyl) transferase LipB [Luteimicrobium subarcticum]|uniref:Octanoyltransferase n=1 Tax=Luteimicrobium subarcticum TaxID=620910 RepID=A0A2M8WRB0_9MICO|nr:lipoyl(octanoyl) transferase LipB [Luteimicrobium subarcticum]PJI93463.1 lipoyl(octanoyl) transferase [Luteimicrobium subarcticum]
MRFVPVGLGATHSPYQPMWELQRAVHGEVADGTRDDTVLLVEHEPVYTAGRRTHLAERPQDGTPVVDIDRGGKVTWHGPGQLVAYPIVRLRAPIDVVAYVRTLEQAVMDVCEGLGLHPVRVDGLTGVWLPADDRAGERKICSIGVRVARGVTMHGLALNCDPDLGQFGRIVPCGIPDADMTSLSRELGRDVTVLETAPLLEAALRDRLADVVVSRDGAPDEVPAALP